jgi:hypothetical protein
VRLGRSLHRLLHLLARPVRATRGQGEIVLQALLNSKRTR